MSDEVELTDEKPAKADKAKVPASYGRDDEFTDADGRRIVGTVAVDDYPEN